MIRTYISVVLLLLSFFMSAQDELRGTTASAEDNRSGKNGRHSRLARVMLDVTDVNAVMVISSFDTKFDGGSAPIEGRYQLSDGSSYSPEIRQSLKNSNGQDKGIGTLVYVFDASSLSGKIGYALSHTSNLKKDRVSSTGTVVAIALTATPSNTDISHDLKSIESPVYTSGTLHEWAPVTGLATEAIQLVEQGDIYLSASVNSTADGTGSGEWMLQHSPDQSTWNDVGYAATRSFTDPGIYGISSLTWIMKELPAGNHYFRVAHRQTGGTSGDLRATNSCLVACALNYEDIFGQSREFPAFARQKASTVTSATTFAPVISHSFNPTNESDLFLHAQYMAGADEIVDAAGYDLVINHSGTGQEELDGEDQFRYIPSSAELEGGGSVGLGQSMLQGNAYGISLRHLTATGTSLSTVHATLVGFQLTSVGNTIWTGAGISPTTWENDDNWSDMVPGNRENAIIPGGLSSYPILTSGVTCENLHLASGASLTMNPSSSLTINADLIVDGSMVAQADANATASILVKGQATGTLGIQSYLTADQWHIISPPLSGQSISSFLAEPSNQIPKKTDANIYGLTDYNEASNSWNGFFAGNVAGYFISGKGYLMRREISDGPVTYNGLLINNDFQMGIPASGSGWSAIGNPFSSAIGVTSDASTAENILTTNLDQLDPSYSVLYVWVEEGEYTGTQNNYRVIGNSGYVDEHNYPELATDYLQAGQGFLVKSAEGGGTLLFNKAMQVHNNSIPVYKSTAPSWDGFKLVAEKGDRRESTIVCFHPDMTLGLDPSYDAGLLNSKPDFSIYTYLPEENQDIPFKIQCLPDSGHADLQIPLGLDLNEGGVIRFFAEGVKMSEGCKIQLEDRKLRQWFDLSSNEAGIKILLGDGGAPADRFVLHISYPPIISSLSFPYPESDLHVHYLRGNIIVKGMVHQGTLAFLHDIRGRQLKTFRLDEGTLHSLPVAEFEQGFYLVTLIDDLKKCTLKVFKNEP